MDTLLKEKIISCVLRADDGYAALDINQEAAELARSLPAGSAAVAEICEHLVVEASRRGVAMFFSSPDQAAGEPANAGGAPRTLRPDIALQHGTRGHS